MIKYDESSLEAWTGPASNTEDSKMKNAQTMIESAIKNSREFDGLEYEIFLQGSYVNNTNVKNDSDIDVCIMAINHFYADYPDGLYDKDYGFNEGTLTYDDYRVKILSALYTKFGAENVELGNKSIKISSNTYHVNADAVVAFQYRDYKSINSYNPNWFIEGTRIIDLSGNHITNYPKDHIKNGIQKNNETNHYYKKLVRLFKRIRIIMADERVIDKDVISSFLVECLVFNTPNEIITKYATWEETIQQAIVYLYGQTKENKCDEWGEVSERLYLFHSGRKWTKTDAKNYVLLMYDYMGY